MDDEFIENISSSDKKLFVGLAGPGTGKSTTFKKIIQNGKFKGKKIINLLRYVDLKFPSKVGNWVFV
ncbi:MAG: hypothetical protein UT66_C0040G0002 [candidate division CPR2 bacterium GW2011_GWC1_39_9]|nr:MAG: hypothetical protein UT66_C0040G0002 [candidate division CPR2 bacterium GW2011_GWC1_39_9]